jgi:hypothetical protein
VIYLSGVVRADMQGLAGVGYMLTPRTRYRPDLRTMPWAADNGRFSAPQDYTDDKYLAWLDTHERSTCLFATAPDVLCDWPATLAMSAPLFPRIRALGYRAALVAQDGLTADDVPWGDFDALFIGGSTEWKLSEDAYAVARAARARGLWCHMGRVNSLRRLRAATVSRFDSVDGTGMAFQPDKRLADIVSWLAKVNAQGLLIPEGGL